MSQLTTFGHDVYKRWRAIVPDELTCSPAPALTTLALGIVSLPASIRRTLGFPPFLQMAGFTTMFGISTYAVNRDKVNGPSIATAWACTYIGVNAYKAFAARNLAASLVVISAAFQVFAYGKRALQDVLGVYDKDV